MMGLDAAIGEAPDRGMLDTDQTSVTPKFGLGQRVWVKLKGARSNERQGIILSMTLVRGEDKDSVSYLVRVKGFDRFFPETDLRSIHGR